jgi:pimeloyl-ACP methyl ester carboxylesterase
MIGLLATSVRRVGWRVLLAIAAVSGAAAVVAEIGLSRSAAPVRVTPTRSREDRRVAIRVAGLVRHASVTLGVFSTDADVPAAVIPVEQIKAPILLACGGQDLTWHSCGFSHAIVDRLAAHNAAAPRSLYAYPQAGHDVGWMLPSGG